MKGNDRPERNPGFHVPLDILVQPTVRHQVGSGIVPGGQKDRAAMKRAIRAGKVEARCEEE